MTDYEKMQYIQYMQMKDELDNVAYNGIRLKLASPDRFAATRSCAP